MHPGGRRTTDGDGDRAATGRRSPSALSAQAYTTCRLASSGEVGCTQGPRRLLRDSSPQTPSTEATFLPDT